jgi:hypothetical protein
MLLWGGWLIVTVLVISLARGIIHPYYSVAVAPAIGAMVGIGSSALWQRRADLAARLTLAVALAATTVWGFILLDRAPQWLPWLRTGVLGIGLGAAVILVLQPRLRGRAAVALGAVGVCAALAGPAAYAVDTVATAHGGAIPSAGPSTGVGPGGFPGGFLGGARGGPAGAGGRPSLPPGFGGTRGSFAPPGVPGVGAPNGFPPGGFGGQRGRGTGVPNPFGTGGFPPGGGRGTGAGGFLSISTPGTKLVKALEAGAGRYTWVAATVNSNSAAGYQLATGDPVMAIGGFNGTDPAPSLAQFEGDVAAKKIHYFIAGGRGLGGGTGSTSGQITQWVESHFTATTINGVAVYDLTAAR